MADIDLTTTVSVPSGTSITVTVYEDVDGDGSAENTASQAIDDGTNTYSLSGFDANGGSYWIEAEFDTNDVTKTAELDSAALLGAGGQVCDLTGLIEDKREQITTLRAEVEQTIGDGVVPDEFFDPKYFREDSTIGSVDEEAEAFIDDLESKQSELGNTDCSNYREALERLVAAEDVSTTAAEGPNKRVVSVLGEDPTIIEETARYVVDGALILSTVGLFKGAQAAGRAPAAARLASSTVDDIAAHARNMKNVVVKHPYFPSPVSRKLAQAYAAAKREFRSLYAEHPEEIAAAFEQSLSTGIEEGTALLPDEMAAELSRLYRGAMSLIAKILYEFYTFSTDILDAEIPPSFYSGSTSYTGFR